MRALVIDDSRAMRRIVGQIMQKLGFLVSEAGDGLEGLTKLNESSLPEIVLVDWNMPNMNGLEFVRSVRTNPNWRGLPIIMVTSETEMSRVVMAFAAGVSEYVMKPFDAQMIGEKIKLLGIGVGSNV